MCIQAAPFTCADIISNSLVCGTSMWPHMIQYSLDKSHPVGLFDRPQIMNIHRRLIIANLFLVLYLYMEIIYAVIFHVLFKEIVHMFSRGVSYQDQMFTC